jgi:hypothetical protein
MSFQLDPSERAALSAEVDDKLLEGLIAMERFTRRLLDHLGVHYEEIEPGVLRVPMDKRQGDLLRKPHLLVFDPSVYPSVEEQNAELLTPASPFFRNLLSKAEMIGPVSTLVTRRATAYTMFHFHVHLKGMNYEWEDILTIGVDDDGDTVEDVPQLRQLLDQLDPPDTKNGDTPEHTTPVKFRPVPPDRVPPALRPVPEKVLEAAPQAIKKRIAPKLDELAAAVETGLRKTQERLAAYYEQMRDEARRDDVKLRRRIGQINAKIFYTEDRIRLLRLEKERDLLAEELEKIKKKSRRALDHLELEEQERMAKEAERARPTVKIRLVAATRVIPE